MIDRTLKRCACRVLDNKHLFLDHVGDVLHISHVALCVADVRFADGNGIICRVDAHEIYFIIKHHDNGFIAVYIFAIGISKQIQVVIGCFLLAGAAAFAYEPVGLTRQAGRGNPSISLRGRPGEHMTIDRVRFILPSTFVGIVASQLCRVACMRYPSTSVCCHLDSVRQPCVVHVLRESGIK